MSDLEDFDTLGGEYHSDGVGHRWDDIRECVIKAHQLNAECERLRRDLEVFLNDAVKFDERVRDIWQEGFEAGESHGNLSYKYPPMAVAWLISEAYSTVEEDPERHEWLRERWRNQNYNDREATVVCWRDLETTSTTNEDDR